MSVPSPVLKVLKVYAFDVHLHLPQLWDTATLRPEFSFLVDRNAYARAYLWNGLPQPQEFLVSPLGRELHDSHFWRHYSLLLPARPNRAAPLPWDRHLPFLMSPRNPGLEYRPGRADLQASTSTGTFLWPYGWSSSLEITLSGPVAHGQFEEVLNEARSGTPFRLGGKDLPLAGVFNTLAANVKRALYQRQVQDYMPVRRSLVVALFWDAETARAAVQSGWDGDWASRVLPPPSENTAPANYTYTRLKAPDFAVTFFPFGSLLSLSPRPGQSPAAMRCVSSNLEHFAMTALVLLNLQKSAKQYAGQSPELDALVDSARSTLLALPEGYRNPVCKRFLAKHRLAKSLGLAPEGEEGQGEGAEASEGAPE